MELDIPEVDNLLFVISCWDFNKDLVDEKHIITNLEDDYNTLINTEDEYQEENPIVKSSLENLKVKLKPSCD